MSGLQFVSSLVGSLAWPCVVAVVVLIFRRPATDRIRAMKSYEGFGQKIGFGEGVAEVEAKVEASASAKSGVEQDTEHLLLLDQSIAPLEDAFTTLIRSANRDPSYVVMASWNIVDGEIAQLHSLSQRSYNVPKMRERIGVIGQLLELRRREILSPEMDAAIHDLRQLRNQVAHAEASPNVGSAIGYAEAARRVSIDLRTRASQWFCGS